MPELSKNVLHELDNAWLYSYTDKRPLYNPLDILQTDDPIRFQKQLTWLLCQPEYFHMLAKHIFNIELAPFQVVILQELWKRKFPMLVGSRGMSKTFLLSLYAMMRAFLIPGRSIIVAGAAFRQSKILFDYMKVIWDNAPVLRDLCDGSTKGPRAGTDMCIVDINGSAVKCIPVGDGSKIRGLRGDIIADEFSSHVREIFEVVMSGFGAVNQNPVASAKARRKAKRASELGIELAEVKIGTEAIKNQIILSGTAYYDFNHFADYWRRWKTIIQSKGDRQKLSPLFGDDGPPEGFKWDDYSVIRVPYDMLPEGFMDEANIARSKATVHNGIFEMEFEAIFSKDSTGFFKRSLIESCTGTETNPVKLLSGEVWFDCMQRGNPHKKYVMGVDPASEIDNFAIIIIELNEDHKRIVHCWTITRKAHIEKVKMGFTEENNFYSYCARKIRSLMDQFNIVHIAIDSQGGGIPISEALHETSNLKEGEVPIWEVIDEDKEKDSDHEAGLHIIELCNFADSKWYNDANHGLRKDFEDKATLFPRFDPISLAYAAEVDAQNDRVEDTLEDLVMEIEELKNELSLIEISQTNSGKDKWDVPETRVGVGKKEKMRKDRYSALIMANLAAKRFDDSVFVYNPQGGFANRTFSNKHKPVADFEGPAWFTEKANGLY